MYKMTSTWPNMTHTDGYTYHVADAGKAQSGSSLIYWADVNVPLVMAIHKKGNAGYNIASRMRPTVWNQICGWIYDHPSAYQDHPCQP